MKKIQKSKLLELVDILRGTHAELAGQLQDTVLDILADCQKCAMAMCDAIEESEGEMLRRSCF